MRPAGASEVNVHGDTGGLARAIRHAAMHVVQHERRRARIAITFVGKQRMREHNARFFDHDDATDVISIPLPQPDGSVAGDILICRYMAARNARAHAVPVREELLRLVVHGTLHVLGWEHPDDATRTRSPMWQRQERYVASLR